MDRQVAISSMRTIERVSRQLYTTTIDSLAMIRNSVGPSRRATVDQLRDTFANHNEVANTLRIVLDKLDRGTSFDDVSDDIDRARHLFHETCAESDRLLVELRTR